MLGTTGSQFVDSTHTFEIRAVTNVYALTFRRLFPTHNRLLTPLGHQKRSIHNTKKLHAYVVLADQEAAHRAAQALVHSALVCGGVKAVSPFQKEFGMKTIAKAHLLLYFALATGWAALAQQASEWRPNISEDNKATTLDDTLRFIVGSVSDSANRSYVPDGKDRVAWFQDMFGASSTAKCSIEWGVSSGSPSKGSMAFFSRSKYVVDLSKVDPLTIKVTPIILADGSPLGFQIAMLGTSGVQFADVLRYSRYNGERVNDVWASVAEANSASCASGDKKCSTSQKKESHAYLSIADQETAHRTARALLHAALLCGGTKAVSPF
jgi:hypothetical protein